MIMIIIGLLIFLIGLVKLIPIVISEEESQLPFVTGYLKTISKKNPDFRGAYEDARELFLKNTINALIDIVLMIAGFLLVVQGYGGVNTVIEHFFNEEAQDLSSCINITLRGYRFL